jgi:hypothetical protein
MEKKMKNYIKLTMAMVGVLFLITVSSGAQAAPQVILDPLDPDNVAAITNLVIGGTPYNVGFLPFTRTADEVYGPFPGVFPFPDEASSAAAADAVNDVLNSSGLEAVGFGGIGSTLWFLGWEGGIGVGPTEVVRLWRSGFGFIDVDWQRDPLPYETFYNFNAGYATFQAVPLPAAVWLLGSGLLGVIGFRRKRPTT